MKHPGSLDASLEPCKAGEEAQQSATGVQWRERKQKAYGTVGGFAGEPMYSDRKEASRR